MARERETGQDTSSLIHCPGTTVDRRQDPRSERLPYTAASDDGHSSNSVRIGGHQW